MRLGLAQVDPVVGDLSGNVERISVALADAARVGCDLVVLPELTICGYPPEDLVLKPRFVSDMADALAVLAGKAPAGVMAVVGFVEEADGRLHNAAAVLDGGSVRAVVRKQHLPNTAVFDEQRYFEPGAADPQVHHVAGVAVGVSICEDAWVPAGPVTDLAGAGAQIVVNLNASPYYAGRLAERREMLSQRTVEAGVPVAYVNQVGGQDELVFDGGSMVVDADGAVAAAAPQFEPALLVVDVDVDGDGRAVVRPLEAPAEPLDRPAEIWAAVVSGTRDYVTKNGFSDVVLGLSGGIDSALVAVIAADALGADNVHTVALPSRHSSPGSVDDADELARRLGCDHRVVSIREGHDALEATLAPHFGDLPPGLAEENLQARLRGTLLMALSNKFGWMLLSTGNKSELAVGYSTLYGDMNGGFNPIKDLLKTTVYELSRWRNDQAVDRGEVPPIPLEIIDKAPSAELRPDQRDDESLPPYDLLDELLRRYVEHDGTVADLVAAGHDAELVARIVGMVDHAEYKRRQAPPGVRVTRKAFGKDRRLPITNAYRG